MLEDSKANAVSIQSLKEFVVLARVLNFSTAAESLYVSQPTLSNHIKRLEENLGVMLFVHGPKPQLTKTGQEFIHYAEDVLHSYAKAVNAIRNYAELPGNLNIDEPINTRFLPEATTRTFLFMENAYPQVRLHLCSTKGMTTYQALKEGVIDIGKMVTTFPEDSEEMTSLCEDLGINAVQIAHERPAVWLQRNHPLALKDTISIRDLVGVPILRPADIRYDGFCKILEKWFLQYDAYPHFLSLATDSIEEYFMTRLNEKVLVLPEHLPLGGNLLAARNVISRPLSESELTYYVHLVSLRDNANQAIPIYTLSILQNMSQIALEHEQETKDEHM